MRKRILSLPEIQSQLAVLMPMILKKTQCWHFVSKNVSSNKTSTDADDESFEIQSVYEVVSDSEYEANKHNPNYFEVSPEEFEKHKNLENKVVLIEKISE